MVIDDAVAVSDAVGIINMYDFHLWLFSLLRLVFLVKIVEIMSLDSNRCKL